MRKWCEEQESEEIKKSSEEVWHSWLKIHNKIAEEGIGRKKKKNERKWLKGEWDEEVEKMVRKKNQLRRAMGRVEGEERKKIVEEYKIWRGKVRKILKEKRQRKQQETNMRLESLRGKDEREYWSCLKKLAGIKKKDVSLPEEVRIGDRVERGEKRKEVWNAAFSKLGKFDLEDKNYDKKAFIRIKKKVERWESERKEGKSKELDREIEKSEIVSAIQKAKNNKAAGEDECTNEILKQGGEQMVESLVILFRKMWKEEKSSYRLGKGGNYTFI